jgi:hypothetical protein
MTFELLTSVFRAILDISWRHRLHIKPVFSHLADLFRREGYEVRVVDQRPWSLALIA